MKPLTLGRIVSLCGLLAFVLFCVVVISLKVGAFPVPVLDVARTLLRSAVGRKDLVPSDYQVVILNLRLPRILLGILVGMALSVAGAGFQALLRNPLADPYVLGVSSGAALGAILALMMAHRFPFAEETAAFVGAGITIGAVYFLGKRGGQLDSSTLLLAGIICASFLSAVIMFLMTLLPGRDLRGMAFWLMGDLSSPPTISVIGLLLLVVTVIVVVIYATSADLNLILTGEQEARHLGVNVGLVKVVVYAGASLLTGVAVALSGAIGYVGLLVPHVMRMLFGSDYRVLIPTSAIGGAIAIVAADALARTVVAPTELPVGAMTAIAGAPVFIYLLRRSVR
ncbi:MAG: FecCD family ABC transporter permease [Candidatus Acidiferrales bacterium]